MKMSSTISEDWAGWCTIYVPKTHRCGMISRSKWELRRRGGVYWHERVSVDDITEQSNRSWAEFRDDTMRRVLKGRGTSSR